MHGESETFNVELAYLYHKQRLYNGHNSRCREAVRVQECRMSTESFAFSLEFLLFRPLLFAFPRSRRIPRLTLLLIKIVLPRALVLMHTSAGY